MNGQKTFAITRAIVNVVFYLALLGTAIVIGIKTFQMFEADPDLSELPLSPSVNFEIISFGENNKGPSYDLSPSLPGVSGYFEREGDYRFSSDHRVALKTLPESYLLHAAYRTPLGLLDYIFSIIFAFFVLYGIALLRKVFNSMSLNEPFQVKNQKRIRNIGLIFIGADLLRLVHYLLFNSLVEAYFPEIKFRLVVEIGNGILVGLIILAISVIYRRGTEIYSENQLTI